jgi:hypothetical protein
MMSDILIMRKEHLSAQIMKLMGDGGPLGIGGHIDLLWGGVHTQYYPNG